MCGELEEEEARAEELYARFVAHAHSLLHSLSHKGGKPDAFTAYLNGLFRDLLMRAADHTKAPEGVGGYDRLAMEPLVMARVAGFMAAHMPLHEDPMRRVLEALMTGYAEGEISLPSHDHDHDHEHGHDHDHGHGHSH
jgi:hypothetical protein